MSSIHSKGSNCEVDTCTVFKSLTKLFFKKPEMSDHTSEIDFEGVNSDHMFGDIDQKRGNPKIRAQLDYVTGYVLRKLKVKNCNKCKECLFSDNNNKYNIIKKTVKGRISGSILKQYFQLSSTTIL